MQTSEFGKSKGLLKTLAEEKWSSVFDGLGISLLLTSNPAIQVTPVFSVETSLLFTCHWAQITSGERLHPEEV